MTRKAKIVICTLAVICSALLAYWLWLTLKDVISVVTVFVASGMLFFLTFVAIYGIIHKKNVKFSKCMLGAGVSSITMIVSLTLLFHDIDNNIDSRGYLAVICGISFFMSNVFLILSSKCE